ncbi:MAG TPA: ComF family protein [Bacteroidales bacterium]|nr:ComF family protein [Bacteroidales bacterium]
MKNFITHITDLFYPRICQVCGKKLYLQEEILCTECIYDMPRINSYLTSENQVKNIFTGRFPVENAAALLFFKKGSAYRKLIHKLKYKKKPEIGIYLGHLLAEDININNINYIVPVPLHHRKKKIRGYNQSEMFAQGISEILNIPIDTQTLIRSSFTQTQTQKTRYERWENVKSVFTITDKKKFQDKHILLVDDIITTGATLEGCSLALLKIKSIKISIAAIGIASN